MEKHIKGLGIYIKDIVYGANDGIITTFAIVTGSFGADFSAKVILILGFANLFADGFSMAASNFLGTRSENSLFEEEEKREWEEVKTVPEKEKEEIEEVFLYHGFNPAQSKELTALVSGNEKFWVDFMMRYELGMNPPSGGKEWLGALSTFIAFITAGFLPILPFLLLDASASPIIYSTSATAGALFIVGSARTLITKKNWFFSGLEMLLVGGIAAGVSYLIGYGISAIV